MIEEQYEIAQQRNRPSGGHRVTGTIEIEIKDEIKQIVRHSLERAIADELMQKVKHEKISKRTPTYQPVFRDEKGSGKLGTEAA